MSEKLIKKLITIGTAAFVFLIVSLNCCSVVDPTERGVLITLGTVSNEILEPGIHFKAPFVTKIKTYDTTPIAYKKSLGIGTDGAITADKQTIGVDYELYWKYKTDGVLEIAKRYSNKDAIYEPISTALKEIIKDEAGRISIAQFINDQTGVSTRVANRLRDRVSYIPIEVTQFSITNLDWSEDYDKAIRETAKIAQEIERAKNEAEVAAAQAQKKVKEAEAEAQAAEFSKQAAIAKAQGEAEAKRIEGEGIAAYNRLVAQNQALEIQLKELEIKKIHEEKWDGHLVPSYIPLTAAGGIVNLK